MDPSPVKLTNTGSLPRLDVESELRKAGQWLIDNPARRKTQRDVAFSLRLAGAGKNDRFKLAGTG